MAPVYVLFPFAVVKRPARIKYDRAFANLKTDTTWWTHGSPTRGGLTCEMAKMWLPRVHCAFFSPLRLRPPLFCHFRLGLSYTVGLTKKYCSNKSQGLSRTNVFYLWFDFLSCLFSSSPPRGSKGTAVVPASGNGRRWSDLIAKIRGTADTGAGNRNHFSSCYRLRFVGNHFYVILLSLLLLFFFSGFSFAVFRNILWYTVFVLAVILRVPSFSRINPVSAIWF